MTEQNPDDNQMDMPPPATPGKSSTMSNPLVIGLLVAVVALTAVVATLLLTGSNSPDTPVAEQTRDSGMDYRSDEDWGDGPISFEAAFFASIDQLEPDELRGVCDLYYAEPNLVYGMFRADLPMEDVSSSELRRLFDRVC